MEYRLHWQVGFAKEFDSEPTEYAAANVPGSAQLDWAAAHGWPDWRRGLHFQDYAWMEDCFWVYKATIPGIERNPGERVFFTSGGIDYDYTIWLEGVELYAYEGMFKGFELDITDLIKPGSVLKVVIKPVPKDAFGEPNTRQEAAQSVKPAVGYGWDWHPRLIPSGIWQDTFIAVRNENCIASAEVFYTLSEDLQEASVRLQAHVTGAGDCLFTLYAPDGSAVVTESSLDFTATVTDPLLWWCNGYGAPNLYRWTLSYSANGVLLDQRSGTIGFRHVKLVMNEGTWDEPDGFPKSRSHSPITVLLNHTRIFAKGSNWVNPEVFTGTITRETYAPLVKLAKDANMNLFRCWGGAIVNKQSFYDLCNESGIMVWQEFPLACNDYRDNAHYLETLESEAIAILQKLRKNPCLCIWCGGNELFNSWSKMTEQSLALRLLDKLCYEYDRETPFLMTSPLGGMAHGCYLFVYPDGQEVFVAMQKAHYTAYTEFGVPSVSNMECCLAVTDMENLFPLEKNPVTLAHHAFDSWATEDTWCELNAIRKYIGEPSSLAQLIEWSQWLQSEGYKAIYEEARRQKPYCSMALNWCYNEPWPSLANNSLINYPAQPKKAYYAVQASCRNQLASARIPHFAWSAGEQFKADIWLLNDGQAEIPAGKVNIYLEYGGEKHFLLCWDHPRIAPNVNLEGPTVKYWLPKQAENDKIVPLNGLSSKAAEEKKAFLLKLVLEAGALSSSYDLIMR